MDYKKYIVCIQPDERKKFLPGVNSPMLKMTK